MAKKYLDDIGLSHFFDKLKLLFATKDAATQSADGLMSSSDKTKLDGLDQLVESASGESVTTSNCSSFESVVIYGKTIQNEIQTVNGMNVLPTPYVTGTGTVSSIQFTENEDGTVTANGTASSNGYYILFGGFANNTPLPSWLVKGETYTMDNGRTDGSNDHGTMMVYFYNGSTTVGTYVQRTHRTFTVPSNATHVGIFLRVLNGNALNYTFKPRIVHGTDYSAPYVPYGCIGLSVDDIVIPINLQGHELVSFPDGTKDLLTVDSVGHCVLTKTSSQTIDLGYIDLPPLYEDFQILVIASVVPIIEVSWWTVFAEPVANAIKCLKDLISQQS